MIQHIAFNNLRINRIVRRTEINLVASNKLYFYSLNFDINIDLPITKHLSKTF